MNFSRENKTKAGYCVCFANLFLQKENKLKFLLSLIAVRKPIVDLFVASKSKRRKADGGKR